MRGTGSCMHQVTPAATATNTLVTTRMTHPIAAKALDVKAVISMTAMMVKNKVLREELMSTRNRLFSIGVLYFSTVTGTLSFDGRFFTLPIPSAKL